MESMQEQPLSATKIGGNESPKKGPPPFNHYSQMPGYASKSFRFENTKIKIGGTKAPTKVTKYKILGGEVWFNIAYYK